MKTGFDFSKVKKAQKAKSLNDMYAGGGAGDDPNIATQAVLSKDVQHYPLVEKINPYEARDVMYPEGHKFAHGQNKLQKEKMKLRNNGIIAERYVPDGKGGFMYKDMPLSLDHIPDKYLNYENFSSKSDPYGYRKDKIGRMEDSARNPRDDEFLIPNYPPYRKQLPSGEVIDPNEKALDNYFKTSEDEPQLRSINNLKDYRQLLKLLYKKI